MGNRTELREWASSGPLSLRRYALPLSPRGEAEQPQFDGWGRRAAPSAPRRAAQRAAALARRARFVPPALTRAGTSQRDVPTMGARVSVGRGNERWLPL